MALALYTHPDMLAHRPPSWHHERPERLTAVLDALGDASGLDLEPFEAPLADADDLSRVHPPRYVIALDEAEPPSGERPLDPDTWLSPGSTRAARRAAGAVAAAVRRVAAGEADRAFCAVRPPGHHAGPEYPMGFCLYSNAAIGARVAQAAGLRRVAIVDFDVHHGNGTQDIAENDPELFFASIHEAFAWPYTGLPTETGLGNVANAVSPPGAPPALWRRLWEGLMARVADFDPDLIIVSAGFDAHVREPMPDISQQLEEADFAWATGAILEAAKGRARGRVVSSLEGGYDLAALGRSALAHVRALQGG
jgi:acetoin utilization deacetylase AcuC-like enzyme